ncbi:P-loop NTPase fold protein [Arthrobacter pascens]|uniref:P-loop NTPase fold protein n=1 Tax=Arthrobacter pascens TaxID=1677 RepID=UPI00196AA750|nr:P-loop NTPase fold protein [Arthrobacter pascens]MBN3496383.1 hypothetical protein [Arthrobacter pascens]
MLLPLQLGSEVLDKNNLIGGAVLSEASEMRWSPSVQKALEWATGCAVQRGGEPTVTANELFVGLLLAHPDSKGEVWQFLDYFGLTARDLLPDDYPIIDSKVLHEAANVARAPEPDDLDAEVTSILYAADSRAGGMPQVLHVLGELLSLDQWQERLQPGLTRFGIDASELVREFNDIIPSPDSAGSSSKFKTPEEINLLSPNPAGEQIGKWLSQKFPRRPATLGSFSNDMPDPRADFIGVSEEADAFAYLIASKTLVPPLAIGLFGDWGSGKSFLMAKIRQRVSQLTSLAATGDNSTSKEIWTKILAIDFNAWQYVETDLWAALLSRIFDELTPQARRKLTELNRQQQEQRALRDENFGEQLRAETAVANLLTAKVNQEHDARVAADSLERVKQKVTALQDAAMRTSYDAHARSAATAAMVGGLGSLLGPQVTNAVEQARRLKAAADTPAWRQSKFWSLSRILGVSLTLFIIPVVVFVLDLRGFSLPSALSIALGAGAALLVAFLRATAVFAEGQQTAALDAAAKVEREMSSHVRKAEEHLASKQKEIEATRKKISEERQKAAGAAARGLDLATIRARLNPGTVYANFLSGRYTSDDYRKRLGIVTTISDDLETLSSLIAEYNNSPMAHQPDGPPNRIVLYIDDLDRCPPQRVVEVLEAVHLLLAFPLFVVVVAVDTRWLKAALSRAVPILQEKADSAIHAPTPTDYLEKIFQIPFWVEHLDEAGRHRLVRGLLLPSVAQSNASRPPSQNSLTSLQVGPDEEGVARTMLAVHGPWLDREAQNFSITAGELAFIEALNPLISGTPRQVKRFVNVCKLLLAMSPPLDGGAVLPTERTAACFMAALHQSMPDFAEHLAAEATSSIPGATLETILSDPSLQGSEIEVHRQRVQEWLAGSSASFQPIAERFGSAHASMILKRWEVIKRMRFEDTERIR